MITLRINMYIMASVGLALLFSQCQAVPFFLPKLQSQQQVTVMNRSLSSSTDYGEYKADRSVIAILDEVKGDCPSTCTCSFGTNELFISNCEKDPVENLEQLLLKYINVTNLQIVNSLLSRLSTQLCNMTKLTTLKVNQNALRELPWECIPHLRNLTDLDASYNSIERLQNGSFYLPLLRTLHLQNNVIHTIDLDVFTQVDLMPSVEYIDLTYNQLTSVDAWIVSFSRKTEKTPEIVLEHNYISRFTNFVHWHLDYHKKPTAYARLKDNNITHISDLFNGLGLETDMMRLLAVEKTTVDIRNNKFTCDCVDFRVYRFLQLVHSSAFAEDLFCYKPPSLYEKRIMGLDLDAFICNHPKDCPANCSCIEMPAKLNISVHCSMFKDKQLPLTLPRPVMHHETFYLNFSYSDLARIDNRPYLSRVKTALFANSRINHITSEAFRSLMASAHTVRLDRNNLNYLPGNISNTSVSVTELTLSANNWTCDCHSLETRQWLWQNRDIIPDRDGMLCVNPTRLHGSNILKLPIAEFICGDPPNKVLISSLIVGGATLGACFILIVLPLLLLSMKRVWIYKVIKWHPFDKDECEGENKEFDVFVSYSNENSEYVEGYLIPELEHMGYKIAYHRIHFLAGKPIHVSIEECILKSKRTLVVFSNDFLISEWCMWEFTVALELDGNQSTHRLLAIKYQDVDTKALDLTIQVYFKRYSYAEKDSPKFWDNLQYSLPIGKIGKTGQRPVDVEQRIQHQQQQRQHQQGADNTEDDMVNEEEPTVPNEDTVHLLT